MELIPPFSLLLQEKMVLGGYGDALPKDIPTEKIAKFDKECTHAENLKTANSPHPARVASPGFDAYVAGQAPAKA